MKQYKAYLDSMNMPYMVWSVDEPREVPNAWNRTVKDTVTYLDWMGEAGITTRMVTPMVDAGGGVDNTVLVDHCDIMMPHANKSCQKLVRDTLAKGKELEFYNCGMSRLSWGFMVWRNESKGRWQWHWSFVDNSPYEGYPGSEWYCPFTKLCAYASNAAIDKYPGGVIYQSAMLNIVEGTTDLAYLLTLEDAIKSLKAAGKKADKVQQAEKLLTDIRNQIPEFSLDEKFQEVSRSLDTWRSQIAGMLKLLNED
jgi:hypothetical protein